MKATVTKENQANAREFYHVSAKDSKGNPVKCRRNGKTKTWKTRPLEFKIPVKYGMYSDQELIQAYRKSRWYAMLPINRAHLTMTLMNRGILKTYKNFTE